MKWIVVILVILNVAAYLLGLKIDPEVAQITSGGQYKVVNAGAMSVTQPTQAGAPEDSAPTSDGEALQEEEMAQLKVDRRGEVLRAAGDPVAGERGNTARDTVVAAQIPRPVETVKPEEKAPAQDKAAKPAGIRPLELAKVEPPKPMEPVEPAPEILACYRLGPFSNQNSLSSVRRNLENQQIQYRVDEDGGGRNIKAVRVYLSVEPGDAAIEAARTRLKEMQVEHYVIRQNGTPMVQLGYFSEPGRATSYQKKLLARGLEVKTETIYHEASISSWLEVQLASREAIDQLKLPDAMINKQPKCP